MAYIFIPFIVMTAPILIVLILLHYRQQRIQARYQTMLQLADKGVELPSELLVEPNLVYCERRRALVLIGGGLGLMAMFLTLPVQLDNGHSIGSLWGLGLFPLMIGLGYLASWWLNQREKVHG